MLFVYAVLVWLGLSVLLAVWMVCQHMLAQRRKPPPVDRNGIYREWPIWSMQCVMDTSCGSTSRSACQQSDLSLQSVLQ